MGVINPDEIDTDEDLGLRILAYTEPIAPCLQTLAEDSLERKKAVALLKGIATEIRVRGPRVVKSQAVGPARVDYVPVSSVITDDDRAALRALCGASVSPSAAPRGSFPLERPISGIWPETY